MSMVNTAAQSLAGSLLVLVGLWVVGVGSLGGRVAVAGFGVGFGLGCFLGPRGRPLLGGTWSVGSRLGSVWAGLSLLLLILSSLGPNHTEVVLSHSSSTA